MTATDDDDRRPSRPRSERSAAGQGSGLDVGRSAARAAVGPARDVVGVSRDGAVVGPRDRFRADRNRSWAARRSVLPGAPGLSVDRLEVDRGDVDPPGADRPDVDRLHVDRLDVIAPPTSAPPGSTPSSAGPVATPPSATPPGRGNPAEVRVVRAAAGADDPTALLPFASPQWSQAPPVAALPVPDQAHRPLDDLVPGPRHRPYGVDLSTAADELFPPSTRVTPDDLLTRRPAGTSTGLQPRIFEPGHGLDESELPVLVGEPPPVRGLPVRPAPPVSLGDARIDPALVPTWPAREGSGTEWTGPEPSVPGPTSADLPMTRRDVSDLESLFRPYSAERGAQAGRAPGEPSALQARMAPQLPTTAPPVPPVPTPPESPAPVPLAPESPVASSLDVLLADGIAAAHGGSSPRRSRGRRSSGLPFAWTSWHPDRRWVAPAITGAIGLVAGIAFASSGDPGMDAGTAPRPAVTVTVPAANAP